MAEYRLEQVEEVHCQDGSVLTVAEAQAVCRVCRGWCCTGFYLVRGLDEIRQTAEGHDGSEEQQADCKRLLQILVPVVAGDTPSTSDQHKYTCRVFDADRGVCTEYGRRPQLCRNYHCARGRTPPDTLADAATGSNGVVS